MKTLSMQWRITLLSALVLLVCTVTLTFAAISNAETSFMSLAEPTQPADLLSSEDADQPIMAVPLVPAQAAKRQFDTTSILVCILFTALGAVAVYFVTGRALRPLLRLTEQIDTIDEYTLSHPLPRPPANDEVGRLTTGFNRMLTRLDDAFLRQKRFTANAAHELKTPLAILKTGAQVLAADPNAGLPDYRENMEMTVISVDRLAKIVDDLLLLASAEETADSHTQEVLLGPLFEAIEGELSVQLVQRQMRYRADCGELAVQSNASLLYRVFFNLVENACKYGREGGCIMVTATQTNSETTLAVTDDGPGIAPASLPYIFDAFYRVDKSRSRMEGGSGLGLSIVKTIVEACGGSITAASDGKTGCCFTITLPQILQ